ncbi:type IV secretory system conjugative DNA transfer family protein [Deinococcus marmoris]|uniref:Conjugal transfer coupling protein TraG n=1 Tax=Deinococcus marmoris TaxID=249408 RepID=A0A1U7NTA0_9DEIO|nr:type IV secretory system conjugative DNA transfer family protein [Deinococcus marmoris]OLV16142.1 Conjugal transfer coupling protein TraG [Deinococcus marmoris]
MIVNYKLFMLRWCLALLVFWVTVFFTMLGQGIFAAAFFLVGSGLVYLFKDSRPQVRHTAHFAHKAEIAPLTRGVFEGDGVMVGFAYKQPLVVRPGTAGKNELGHFLWVGPSRSGKGLSIASNLYNWEGSAIVVDIKGEIAEQTAGYRRDVLGQDVFILNPSGGESSHQFDPFKELETDEQIFSAAIGFMQPDKDGANAIFAQRASAALAALIKAAKVSGAPTVAFLDSMIYQPHGLKGTALRLQALRDPQVTRWLNSFLGKDPDQMDWDEADGDRFLNNSWQRLRTAASFLITPGVKHMTGGSDFMAANIVDRPTTVYLVFRESELTLNLALFNLVIDAIFRSIMRRYDLNPSLEGQKILTVFDEAFRASPNLLAEYAGTVAGRGIYLCIYIQSLAQLSDIWGKEGRTVIMENAHTKVFLPAVDRSDDDREGTSSFVSASCGKYMMEDRGMAKEEHGKELNTNVRMTERELISASEFAMLGAGKSIILCNDFPPILAHRLEPWRFKEHASAQQSPAPRPPGRSDTGRLDTEPPVTTEVPQAGPEAGVQAQSSPTPETPATAGRAPEAGAEAAAVSPATAPVNPPSAEAETGEDSTPVPAPDASSPVSPAPPPALPAPAPQVVLSLDLDAEDQDDDIDQGVF